MRSTTVKQNGIALGKKLLDTLYIQKKEFFRRSAIKIFLF